jgi:hypothetical protein
MRPETELAYHRRIGPKDDNNNNGGSDSGRSDDGRSDDGHSDDGNGNDAGNDNSNSNEHQDKPTTPPCPQCGKTDKVIPIIYGYPGEDLFRDQQAGKVRLGGCCVSGDGKDPQWYCKRDREEF